MAAWAYISHVDTVGVNTFKSPQLVLPSRTPWRTHAKYVCLLSDMKVHFDMKINFAVIGFVDCCYLTKVWDDGS